jgi:hypothetical protein
MEKDSKWKLILNQKKWDGWTMIPEY